MRKHLCESMVLLMPHMCNECPMNCCQKELLNKAQTSSCLLPHKLNVFIQSLIVPFVSSWEFFSEEVI